MVSLERRFNLLNIFIIFSLILTLIPSNVFSQGNEWEPYIVNPSIEFFEILGTKVSFSYISFKSRLLTDIEPWRSVKLLSPSDSTLQYIESQKYRIDIYQSYPNGKNPHEMASFLIHASKTNPLELDILKKHMGLGERAINELTIKGKEEKGQLVEDLEYYAVNFKKIESGVFKGNVEITGWIPAFMLQK